MIEEIRVVDGSVLDWILKVCEIKVETVQGSEWQQITGLNYKELGHLIGDILGRTTVDFN